MGSKSVVLLLFTFVFQVAYAQLQLQAVITTEKATFYLSEPIHIQLVLKNTLDTLVHFEEYDINRHMQIWNQDRRLLDLKFKVQGEANYYIFPSDSMVDLFNITTLFGNIAPNSENNYYGLPQGKYIIQFKMHKKNLSVVSNELTILISHPPLTEEKAFFLFNKAKSIHSIQNSEYKLFYRQIINNYPLSVYSPNAMRAVLLRDNIIENSLAYIEKYPNSYEIWYEIRWILLDYSKQNKDKAGAEDFLRELIKKSPGTFAAQEAQYWLAKIEPLTIEEWLNPELATERRLKEYYEKQQKH